MISRLFKHSLLLLLGGLLSACVESTHPLSVPQPFPADSPLIGTWRMQKEGDATFLHIGNRGNTGQLIDVEFGKDGKVQADSYVVIPAQLNGVSYLSLRMPEKPKPRYVLLKYQISNGSHLTIWPADRDFIKSAVQQGLLKGKVMDKTMVPGVLILADRPALQTFVIEHDAQIFNGTGDEFERVR